MLLEVLLELLEFGFKISGDVLGVMMMLSEVDESVVICFVGSVFVVEVFIILFQNDDRNEVVLWLVVCEFIKVKMDIFEVFEDVREFVISFVIEFIVKLEILSFFLMGDVSLRFDEYLIVLLMLDLSLGFKDLLF